MICELIQPRFKRLVALVTIGYWSSLLGIIFLWIFYGKGVLFFYCILSFGAFLIIYNVIPKNRSIGRIEFFNDRYIISIENLNIEFLYSAVKIIDVKFKVDYYIPRSFDMLEVDVKVIVIHKSNKNVIYIKESNTIVLAKIRELLSLPMAQV